MSGDHGSDPRAAWIRGLEDVLEARGIVTGAEIDAFLDAYLRAATPWRGAHLVAHAWRDGAFKELLLDDTVAALAAIDDFDPDDPFHQRVEKRRVQVVENTVDVHNVIVCTLCSCYPTDLLGPSPSWYKSEAYRSRVVRDPRSVLAEFGLELEADVAVRVWDASAEWRYMVLPRRPADADTASVDELARRVTRAGLIGTADL